MIEDVKRTRIANFTQGNSTNERDNNTIMLYHNLSYASNYEDEADAVKKIIARGVTAVDDNTNIAVRVYCKSQLTASLVMRNSTAPKKALENETNVVYEFSCPDDACRRRSVTYVGLTRQTQKGRMKGHVYKGAIHDHYISVHDRRAKVDELVTNSTIIHREPERKRLTVAEAVSIALRKPKLNVQCEFDYVLPSRRRRPEPTPTGGSTQEPDVVIIGEQRAQQVRRPAADNGAASSDVRRSLRPLPHRIV